MSNVSSDKPRVNILKAVLGACSIIMLYLLGQFAALAGYKLVTVVTGKPLSLKGSPLIVCALYLLSTAVMFGLLYVLMKKTHVTFRQLKLGRPKWGDLGYALLGFGAYFMIAQIVYVLIHAFVPMINLNQTQELGIKSVEGPALIIVFITIVIAPALVEELMFRGYLLQRFWSSNMSYILSAVLVSGLFGLAHMQVNVAIDTFILSMVMMFVLRERNSLWATIGMHFLKNSLAFLALFIFKIA